jgi:hypothetical protein
LCWTIFVDIPGTGTLLGSLIIVGGGIYFSRCQRGK